MSKLSIEFYFSEDHDKLEDIFKQYQLNKEIDFPKAKRSFEEFSEHLKRHMTWEEEILFPLFEEKTALRDAGPTVVMREEHREILNVLEAIDRKVQKKDPATDHEEVTLLNILKRHNNKEESILYPLIDELTDYSERDEIFKKMASLSSERTCCHIKGKHRREI